MSPGSYFTLAEGGLVPAPEARSPWAADMLHGRLLAGLAARAVERETSDGGLHLTRLTVDLFRSPPMDAFQVATAVARDGRRVLALDVSVRCRGEEVARARALCLRTGPHPTATIWTTGDWSVPRPEDLPRPGSPAGDALWSGWDIRPISPGGIWSAEQKRVWTRDDWALVEGEPVSPVVRAALASDLPNPLANGGPEGLQYINADLTLFLRRQPVSDWIGLEVSEHLAQDGIAIGSCRLYDLEGAIGWSSVCAVANPTMTG